VAKSLQNAHENNIIHRDLGYLCCGLTIIYAISGVAVNHIHQWNPNYVIEKSIVQIDPVDATDLGPPQLTAKILQQLDRDITLRNSFQPNPETVDALMKINLSAGVVALHRGWKL